MANLVSTTITGNLTASGNVTATAFSGDGSALTGISGGKVGQVVQTYKTDTFSTSSSSFVDVTGVSVTITPSATNSKILILLTCVTSQSVTGWNMDVQLLRDATVVGSSTGATTDNLFTGALYAGNAYVETLAANYLDSPSTTSSITYKLQAKVGANTGYFGRRGDGTSDGYPTSLTAMEILA